MATDQRANFELDSAAVLIVEALYIAATQNKALAVADYLDEQLAAGTLTLLGLRHQFQLLTGTQMPTVSVKQHDLSSYDQLLSPVHLIEHLEASADRHNRINCTQSQQRARTKTSAAISKAYASRICSAIGRGSNIKRCKSSGRTPNFCSISANWRWTDVGASE